MEPVRTQPIPIEEWARVGDMQGGALAHAQIVLTETGTLQVGMTPSRKRVEVLGEASDPHVQRAEESFRTSLVAKYGPDLTDLVMSEVGQVNTPEDVGAVFGMLKSCEAVYDAMNWVLLLEFSAENRGHEFGELCAGLGLAPAQLTLGQQQRIDQLFQEAVRQESHDSCRPINTVEGRDIMRTLILANAAELSLRLGSQAT